MSKWVEPFGLLRAEIFDETEEQPPLWETDEVLLVLLLIIDVLTLPLAVLLLLGIGRNQEEKPK